MNVSAQRRCHADSEWYNAISFYLITLLSSSLNWNAILALHTYYRYFSFDSFYPCALLSRYVHYIEAGLSFTLYYKHFALNSTSMMFSTWTVATANFINFSFLSRASLWYVTVLVYWYATGKIGSRDRSRPQQSLCWRVFTQNTWDYFPQIIQIS